MPIFRLIARSLLALLLLSPQLPTGAQQTRANSENARKKREFKVVESYPLISIDADIFSRTTGAVVDDLRKEDFIIAENNSRQVVALWQHLPVPLSLLVVVDSTGGYADMPSVANRVNALESSLALSLKPEDKVSVMVLTEGPLLLQDYTGNKDLIRAALNRALQRKETPQVPLDKRVRIAVLEAAKHAEAHNSTEARRATVLISDLPREAANDLLLPEWVVRKVLESESSFSWSRSDMPTIDSSEADTISVDRVAISTLVSLTGGEFVGEDWKSFLNVLERDTGYHTGRVPSVAVETWLESDWKSTLGQGKTRLI